MILGRLLAMIFETALKHTFTGGFTAVALLGEGGIKLGAPIFGKLNIFAISFFDRKLEWEAVSILQHKELFAG